MIIYSSCVLKLAPIAFKNPNKYLTQSETSQDVKDLEILLKSQSSSKSGGESMSYGCN